MRAYAWMMAIVVALSVGDPGWAGESCCAETSDGCFLKRLCPTGGWNPYGGGLLRWWNCNCFPCCGAPDDYVRKPLPKVCWPAYPPYYIAVPPDTCYPQGNCCHNSP
jgi:hypothetical protein